LRIRGGCIFSMVGKYGYVTRCAFEIIEEDLIWSFVSMSLWDRNIFYGTFELRCDGGCKNLSKAGVSLNCTQILIRGPVSVPHFHPITPPPPPKPNPKKHTRSDNMGGVAGKVRMLHVATAHPRLDIVIPGLNPCPETDPLTAPQCGLFYARRQFYFPPPVRPIVFCIFSAPTVSPLLFLKLEPISNTPPPTSRPPILFLPTPQYMIDNLSTESGSHAHARLMASVRIIVNRDLDYISRCISRYKVRMMGTIIYTRR
jgi:hypothetical protein